MTVNKMTISSRRRYHRALSEGTTLLDRGYEQLRQDDEIGAKESAEKALFQLRLAHTLSGFTFETRNGSELADEIERSQRLLERVSYDTPDPRSPASAILVFDNRITAGDNALRDGDRNGARDAYIAAYAALYSLLPQSDAADLPSPPEASTSPPPVENDRKEGICGLCWVASPSRSLKFRGDSVRVCRRCSDIIGERFSTVDATFTKCERVLTDVREVIETNHGLPWISSADSERDDSVPNSTTQSETAISPEQMHMLRDLLAVSQEVGRPATPADLRKHGTHDPSTVRAAFGSWDRALRETGLDTSSE